MFVIQIQLSCRQGFDGNGGNAVKISIAAYDGQMREMFTEM